MRKVNVIEKHKKQFNQKHENNVETIASAKNVGNNDEAVGKHNDEATRPSEELLGGRTGRIIPIYILYIKVKHYTLSIVQKT